MKLKSKIFYCYVLLVAIYAILTLVVPTPTATLQKYHVTAAGVRVIDLSFIIVLAAIWFAGFYSFQKLWDYCLLIKKSKDGKQILKITEGIFFLVIWFPITGITGAIFKYWVQRDPGVTASTTIIQNYLSLLIPLIGFIFISRGARGLSENVKSRPTERGVNILMLILISFGVLYGYLVTTTHNRFNNVYHLPLALIFITVVIPYIFMWFLGLLSVYELYLYRQKVAGIFYRQSWNLLGLGIGSIIVLSIAVQYITTLSERLTRLSFNSILLIIYALLILIAVGYVLLALGAKKLQKIEEV